MWKYRPQKKEAGFGLRTLKAPFPCCLNKGLPVVTLFWVLQVLSLTYAAGLQETDWVLSHS